MAESSATATDARSGTEANAAALPAGWLSRRPWATFLLPMAVYMLVGSLEPTPPDTPPDTPPQTTAEQEFIGTPDEQLPLEQLQEQPSYPPEQTGLLPEIPYRYYPWVYTAKIVLTVVAMLVVCPGYRTFSWRVSGLSIVVGVVGVVLWIVLCHLRLEEKIVGPVDRFLGGLWPWSNEETPSIGLMAVLGTGERSAFNPLEQLAATPLWAYLFLVIRFTGLALIVPVIEEFFLRGFLMRYVIHVNWWQVPFGQVNRTAVILGTAIAMLMHPGELLAALVWFSMVTWLMVRTRNIWDCVMAHAVTNLLLGIYVVTYDEWQLM
ncbi:MAG: CAAX prenyl protease-related protein [Planctomycetes bacterium]|nr:CAAX prenyl protease-related protein [Planctomycetota bacterium]